MFTIKKLRANGTIDFAAEELKKYLRMMMPECGDIEISYDPEAKDGFRLGLLEDFALSFEGEDVFLDDVIHVDTDENGGVLAGSNPRSILFAVYRFLRLNGCRWLYPGIDGDYVPVQDITPQKYHKLASHRLRGHCDEGAQSQQAMLEVIDFYAKQELNTFSIEFFSPWPYYDRYYSHHFNEKNRIPEPIPEIQAMQWKRQCEVELSKRGMLLIDVGHGWCTEPLGIPSTEHWSKCVAKGATLSDEVRKHLAFTEGKRDIFHNHAKYTNLCFSQPETRKILVDFAVDYAKKHGNVDILSITFADNHHNHCECEECQKMRPSDYYIMLLNEIDAAFTKEGIDMRIAFALYVDTYFAPIKERLKNEKRFVMMYAPIKRSYSNSINENSVIPEQSIPYVRNAWRSPSSTEEVAAFLRDWKKICKTPGYVFEYHWWLHQYYDPGHMTMARRIYEDVLSLKYLGLQGSVEDGTKRGFFPNGFSFYIYAETLMDRDCNYEEIREDYFKHIYGEDFAVVLRYLEKVSAAFDLSFMEGELSKNERISFYYDPDRVPELQNVHEYTAEIRRQISLHMTMPTRPQTVSWRLLLDHAEYCDMLADCMIEKVQGRNALALEKYQRMVVEFGKRELAIERYYDHMMAMNAYSQIFNMVKERKKYQIVF